MNEAEAKRYVEENITIMSMIISSSHSYIYLPQILHNSRVFLLLNDFIHKQSKIFQGAFILRS